MNSGGGWHHARSTVNPRNLLLFLAVLPIWALAAPGQSRLLGPSVRDDLATGEELARQIEREIGLVTAPTTEAYLREVVSLPKVQGKPFMVSELVDRILELTCGEPA